MSANSPLLFKLSNGQARVASQPKGAGRPRFSFSFHQGFEFSRQVDRDVPFAQSFANQQYRLDLNSFGAMGHRPLARLEADLAIIALAVYLADRASLRYPYGLNGATYWRRSLQLEICVSDASRWQACEDALVSTLEFLTEDDWSFTFLSGRPVSSAESQLLLWEREPAQSSEVSLFSGGLDSLAGAIRSAASAPAGRLVLVSGVTHNRLAGCQSDQTRGLRAAYPSITVDHLQIDYGFGERPKSLILDSTQRTRAFVHTALGSISASMAGASSLNIFENGIGAINLPLDATQLGSQNSRGTHPVFVKRMSALVSEILQREIAIRLPYQFATKAEVLSHPAIVEHRHLLALSNSCDIYPNYLHRQTHCGACPACIFRRMSLRAAGLPDPDDMYSSTALASKSQTPASNLNRMEHQATVLRRSIPEGWDALAVQFPALYDLELEVCADSPSSRSEFRAQVLSLYLRYLNEWADESSILRLLPLSSRSTAAIPPQCPPPPSPHPHPILVKDSVKLERPAA